MVFLRSPFAADAAGPIEAGPLTLRIPAMQDYEAWSSLRLQSRAFLAPWEPSWPQDDLTKTAFRTRIKRYHRDIEADAAYPFFIFRNGDGALLGALTLSNVRRGVAQMASLGYWIGAPHQRQGHMTAAVVALTAYAFAQQRLHRIEAACLPANAASIALLRRCGFSEEGYARQYLKISGKWQDHLLLSLLASDQLQPPV
jgi:[ribosomal protein S5]-alanine N-acetyltransferase